jgi:hypothetical protein
VKLGHTIAASTVWEILNASGVDPAPRRAGPTWWQFLAAQAQGYACDFLHADTIIGRRIYILVFVQHASRRLHIVGVTAQPTGDSVAQQARNLAMTLDRRLQSLRFLIRDRDTKYFRRGLRSRGRGDHHESTSSPESEFGVRTPHRHVTP